MKLRNQISLLPCNCHEITDLRNHYLAVLMSPNLSEYWISSSYLIPKSAGNVSVIRLNPEILPQKSEAVTFILPHDAAPFCFNILG